MIDQHVRPRELIAMDLDDTLTADERSELHLHVADCVTCREMARRLRVDAAALAESVPVTPPTRIRREIERAVTIPPLDPSLIRVMRIAAAAALVLIAITVLAIGVRAVPAAADHACGDPRAGTRRFAPPGRCLVDSAASHRRAAFV